MKILERKQWKCVELDKNYIFLNKYKMVKISAETYKKLAHTVNVIKKQHGQSFMDKNVWYTN